MCSAILKLVPVDIENVNLMFNKCISADSCDCEEFGLPLAKRIHGLNLLQTKVVFFRMPIPDLNVFSFDSG